ncbi:MAG: hypothetical protein HY901_32255 [Deltaproteobacteria bacterium]|nr:hypothetical protein [Deltaproteobacteria bacterium]
MGAKRAWLAAVVVALCSAAPSASLAARAARKKAASDLAASELVSAAQTLYDDLEYEQVATTAKAALERRDLTPDQRLKIFELQACALAIAGDPLAAEAPFRFILRSNPSYDLPASSPPQILRVLRKVQIEERALAEQLREQQRRALLQTLHIEGEVGPQVPGGEPLDLSFRLRDPRGAVGSLKVGYRRRGESDFSALALQRQQDGIWKGSIPAAWTASPAGFDLEYYLTTTSAEGESLLQRGSPEEPLSSRVEPGAVRDATPFYKTVWFWTLTGLAAAAVAGAGVVAYEQRPRLPQGDLPPYPLP